MRTTNTIKLQGVGYVPVKVECEITPGIGIHLVGLADLAVKESLLRTITAMQACGYRIPGKKIVINLAPADLNKSGGSYDLSIALGILAESGQAELPYIESLVVLGELALDGQVRMIPGAVQAVRAAVDQGFGIILPRANARELKGLFDDYKPVYYVENLREAIEVAGTLKHVECDDRFDREDEQVEGWWDRITGHVGAKRALEIAAAGGHNVLMMGAPGSCRSALAKAVLDILPPMSKDEAMEVSKVYSVAGRGPWRPTGGRRPFRAPHYSASMAAMLGGGVGECVLPGEVSLANNGVLFLDEYAELPRAMRDALRGPMEDGKVVISRLKSKVEYPTRFQLIAGTNPCSCGYHGEGDRCKCTTGQREAYLASLSGPVCDMLTMHVWVHPEVGGLKGEPAAVVAERVRKARELQMKRQGKLNDELKAAELPELGDNSKDMAETLMERMSLSARAYTRMLKIARTIADLEGYEAILPQHLAEAASYRFLDRRTI